MNIRKISLCLLVAFTIGLLTVSFLFPFIGDAANNKTQEQKNDTESQTSNLKSDEPPNYDAFATSSDRSDEKQQNAQITAQKSEGGHLTQFEPRLGVPTFLWASQPGPEKALKSQDSALRSDIEATAREHLGRYALRYRLKKSDISNARVASIHNTGQGAIIVKFRQSVGSVEVFRDEINVIMNRNLQLVALSGYLTGDHTADNFSPRDFQLQPENVVAKAVEDLTGTAVETLVLRRLESDADQTKLKGNKEQNTYIKFTADNEALQNIAFRGEPARAKKVMYHMPDGYIPAYYVEVEVAVPSAETDVLSISGEATLKDLSYSYVISAADGQVLFRKNLVAESDYSYRVWADPTTKLPYDTPGGNGLHPKPDAIPNGLQFPFVAASDVTLQNFPFSQNDPWLPPGSTETVGNNVDAFANIFGPDGYGPVASPADPATGDFRAQVTSPGQFLHTHTPDANPATAEARQASVQQLFYSNNFLHDWFYDAGFNEASGNAQTSNFGRGGLENDSIKAQAQDFQSRNNANMLTPADGGRPRMRMYLFDTNAVKYFDVQSPAGAAGQRTVGTGQFGAQTFDVTNQVVQPSPAAGCTAASFTGTAGKFVMVNREPTSGAGACSVGTKLNNAMAAGAAGFILVNLSTTPNTLVTVTGSLPTFTIPFLTITWNGAASIKTQLAVPNTVSARMRRDAGVDRDGTLDNQIVFHEWGHYISNRLIGDGSGLNTNHSGGLGEGWGDFTAMLALTVRPDDTLTPTNATWNGTYALATYATSGGENNGYYFGIRRYPYSTDMSKNPLTFKHIQNGNALPVGPPVAYGADGSNNAEVHNMGEVWTTMLWECYAALLRDTQGGSPRLTFQQAQDRMKNYLVAAFKMTPPSPTLLEARDALLVAAFTQDQADGLLFAQAFAKRGAGVLAVAPDRNSSTNSGTVESFNTGSNLSITNISLTEAADSCDNDNIVDNGERGQLSVTVKNVGSDTLTNVAATVASSSPKVSFPNGATVNFPTILPFQTATVSVVIAANGLSQQEVVDFTVSVEDPITATPGAVVQHLFAAMNYNELPNSSTVENVESLNHSWTISKDPVLDSTNIGKWYRAEDTATSHHWHGPDSGFASDHYLITPVLQVGTGNLTMSFKHRFDFETDGGGKYDGGVIEVSTDGGTNWTDLNSTVPVGYNFTLINYAGNENPLRGRLAFASRNTGYPSYSNVSLNLGTAFQNQTNLRIRFRIGTDNAVGAGGWDIDDISFTGLTNTPFTTIVANQVCCPTIGLTPGTVPDGTSGTNLTTTLTPTAGFGPFTYTIAPNTLPPGLSSQVSGDNLVISGTPTTPGSYPVSILVADINGCQGTVNYTFTVLAKPVLIAKAFAPASIPIGTNSTVTLTLTNSNTTGALTNASFTDNLVNMSAVGGAVSGTCAGTTPNTLSAGATALSFSGITIPNGGSCTVVFSVTSSTPGVNPNITSSVTADQTAVGAASNTANLTVTVNNPTIAKAFAPNSIQSGGSSTVTLTLGNTNAVNLTNASFTDTLTNMSAVGGAVGGTCIGTTPATLTAGQTSLSFSGITIPANNTCTVTFAVTSNTRGAQQNATSGVTTNQTPSAGAVSNTVTLTVIAPPTIAKSFSPSSIALNGNSTVTLILTNSNTTGALTNASFSDTLTNMRAVGGAAGGTCAGASSNVLSANSTALSFSGITIPNNASCTVTFSVTSSTPGVHPNATSGVTTNQTPTPGAASNTANLRVITLPAIAKAFTPTLIQPGGVSIVTLYLSNTNDFALTNASFSDTLVNMSAVGGAVGGTCLGTSPNTLAAGATNLSFSGIAIPARTNCTVTYSVTSNQTGTHPNVISGVLTNQTSVAGAVSNTANLTVTAPPVITKSFSPASIPVGGTSTLSLTITNPSINVVALNAVGVEDVFPAGIEIDALPNETNSCSNGTFFLASDASRIFISAVTIPVNTSCTFTVQVKGTTQGFFVNTTGNVTSSNGGHGNTASATLSVGMRTNVALATNGGVASASSALTNGSPAIAIDGIRNWATTGTWKDATPNVFPDYLQVDFNGNKSIQEIDVYAVKDDFSNPTDPTEDTTFSLYGITSFNVQYWDGINWADVPNGNVSNTNKVITKLVFPEITTTKIRVVVNNAQANYSRIVEIEAWMGIGGVTPTPTPMPTPTPTSTPTPTPTPTPVVRTNVALATNGGVASASSQLPGGSPNLAIDSIRNWATSGAWKDATANVYPDILQVDFNGGKTINEIDVFAVKDDYSNPADPTESSTFSIYGITNFDVQYWDGSNWVTVQNGNIVNNNKVITKIIFPAITTTKIRVVVNNAQASYSRIVEVEAWSG